VSNEQGVGRPVPERADVGEPMTEGELWSFLRSVMSQGADIRCDYEAGRHQGYEAYSARLDAAASERAEQLWARLKTPNGPVNPTARQCGSGVEPEVRPGSEA